MKQTHRPPRSIYPAQNRHMRRRTRVLAGLVALTVFAGPVLRMTDTIADQLFSPRPYVESVLIHQEGARP